MDPSPKIREEHQAVQKAHSSGSKNNEKHPDNIDSNYKIIHKQDRILGHFLHINNELPCDKESFNYPYLAMYKANKIHYCH